MFGLHGKRGAERAALISMVLGTGVWLLHLMFGAEQFMGCFWPAGWIALPIALSCAGLGAIAYLLSSRAPKR